MQSLVVRSDPGTVRRGGVSVVLAAFPRALAVHVDVGDPSNDAALQRRFDGATVYGYGPLALRCGADAIPYVTVITRPHATLRVVRIERTHGSSLLHAGYDTSDDAFAFKAIDPLRVMFDPNVRPKLSGLAFSIPAVPAPAGDGRPESMAPTPTRSHVGHFKQQQAVTQSISQQLNAIGCRTLETVAADEWQLERLTTTQAHTPGPADIKIGQTHEQVAEIAGFPSVYATKAELMGMAEWRYDLPAPFSWVVTFDGDRVVRYQPPGDLP